MFEAHFSKVLKSRRHYANFQFGDNYEAQKRFVMRTIPVHTLRIQVNWPHPHYLHFCEFSLASQFKNFAARPIPAFTCSDSISLKSMIHPI